MLKVALKPRLLRPYLKCRAKHCSTSVIQYLGDGRWRIRMSRLALAAYKVGGEPELHESLSLRWGVGSGGKGMKQRYLGQ